MSKIPISALTSFGALLKYLRRRARLRQRDLSIMLGYSESQISRLETNRRPPDISAVEALFLNALQIEDEPEIAARLLDLAKSARDEQSPDDETMLDASEGIPSEEKPSYSINAAASQPMVRDNLPYALTSFVGRIREIADLKRLLSPGMEDTARMVTLTGSGGCGKTRLSLQVAGALQPEFTDGVWFVELAAISEPALVPQAVARSLGLHFEGDYETFEQRLISALRHRQMLLVIDNCEHLLEAAAHLTEGLLRACSHLSILATSREVLGVPGETAYRVPSLSVPDASSDGHIDLATLAQVESVQLFTARARAVRPSFALNERNAAAVAYICGRLDGIPLAIELAAARVSILRAAQIAERLEANFRLLSSSSHTVLPRHQTLRATIGWSYALLSEPERAMLQRLSVFAGGWSLEAVGPVAAEQGEPLDDVHVLDKLGRLVDKSLVMVDLHPEDEPRYRMLETVRQYAQEKLEETNTSEETHRRHLAYYLALVETAEPKLEGPDQQEWLQRLDQEQNNVREAIGWALEHDQVEEALRMAGSLYVFTTIRGVLMEDAKLALAAVEQGKKTEATRQSPWLAKALLCAGALFTAQQNIPGAQPLLEEALQLYQRHHDLNGIGRTWLEMALLTFYRGELSEARRLCNVSSPFLQEAGDHRNVGKCLVWLSALSRFEEDLKSARSLLEQGIVELEKVGDPFLLFLTRMQLAELVWFEGETVRARAIAESNLPVSRRYGGDVLVQNLYTLSIILVGMGEYDTAKPVVEEAYALSRSLGMRSMPVYYQSRLAELAFIKGDLAQARAIMEESIQESRLVNADCLPWQLCLLGDIALEEGSLEQAEALVEQCISMQAALDYRRDLHYTLLSRGNVLSAKGDLAQAGQLYRESLALVQRRGMILEIPARLEALAKAAALEGQSERAARLFGGASAQRRRFETPQPPVERTAYERCLQDVRAGLAPEVFQTAWEWGSSLPPETLVAYALGEVNA